MVLVTITFKNASNTKVILTEGLIQMLWLQTSNNEFTFEVEHEEIDMLISEIDEEIEFPIETVTVEDGLEDEAPIEIPFTEEEFNSMATFTKANDNPKEPNE